ncbi:SRPBCC family protein [Xylanimonas ulmi]|uniref:Polyketide cyclase/dehydrase/lipid transport protein n=1 Tax=Xylanimonas ulmi TaxID=228973 RepID=A0A4Q7M3H2_9MICO|nr:SRPBCC family protein [Xylanibacterium ulmi]RZS61038.1 hypothetical protein EV386_1319 [Xylanibacterium ulmi]
MSDAQRTGLPWVWGATPADVDAPYGCDRLAASTQARLLRAVAVDADPEVVFAWLGNLRVAPYSYDWLDNFGRRSPRTVAAHLGPFAPGQRVMRVFDTIDVIPGSEITIRTRTGTAKRLFGDVLVTYRVVGAGPGRSRIVVAARLGDCGGVRGAARRLVLGWGDLLMIRKQLLTLRRLAETDGGRHARGRTTRTQVR